MLDEWAKKQSTTLDMFIWMNKLTLEGIGRTGFGYSFHAFEDKPSPLSTAIDTVLTLAIPRIVAPKFLYGILNLEAPFRENLRILREDVNTIVKNRRKSISENGKNPKDCMLDYMLDNDSGLSEAEIIDHTLTLVIGGSETTGNMLAWAVYCLCLHQEVQKKAAEEVLNVLGTNIQDFPLEKVGKFPYLISVLNETLRLYPPAGGYSKVLFHEFSNVFYIVRSP
jgi:cytochrome P450